MSPSPLTATERFPRTSKKLVGQLSVLSGLGAACVRVRSFSCRTALFLFSPSLSSVESVDSGVLSSPLPSSPESPRLASPRLLRPSSRSALFCSVHRRGRERGASRPRRPCPTPPSGEEGGESHDWTREQRNAMGRRYWTARARGSRNNSEREFVPILIRQKRTTF